MTGRKETPPDPCRRMPGRHRPGVRRLLRGRHAHADAGAIFTEPARDSAPAASTPPLPDAAQTWCLAHLGGVGADEHRVEDMAIVNRLIAGASTPAEISSRWARLSPDQLRRDPAFVLACLAAYAASSGGAELSLVDRSGRTPPSGRSAV